MLACQNSLQVNKYLLLWDIFFINRKEAVSKFEVLNISQIFTFAVDIDEFLFNKNPTYETEHFLFLSVAKRMGRYSLEQRTSNILEVKAIEAKTDGTPDNNANQC